MKEFAKKFYKSKAWQRCRQAYINNRIMIDGGMCEICRKNIGEELHHVEHLTVSNINNPNVTLNHDNLMWICRECHFAEHKEYVFRKIEFKKPTKILTDGVWFDGEGMMHKQKVIIVYGSAASGKTTYVKKHMADGDLVIDLDLILQAIGMTDKSHISRNLLNIAFDVRELLYTLVEQRKVDCKTVWIVATLPKKKTREELSKRLGAELVFISATYEQCIERAKNDPNRTDMTEQKQIISNFFENYEP